MSAKKAKKQHEILVQKQDLTTKSLSPTSQELFDMMHLTSCDHAIKRWKDEWILCPVCSLPYHMVVDPVHGVMPYHPHKTREELLV